MLAQADHIGNRLGASNALAGFTRPIIIIEIKKQLQAAF